MKVVVVGGVSNINTKTMKYASFWCIRQCCLIWSVVLCLLGDFCLQTQIHTIFFFYSHTEMQYCHCNNYRQCICFTNKSALYRRPRGKICRNI